MVAMLRRMGGEWNAWRENNRDIIVDLSNADIRRVNLDEKDLSEVNLSNVNLIGAYLVCADLRNAILKETNLVKTDLFHANLTQANLNGAILVGADLGNTTLNETSLRGAIFSNSNLGDASLNNATIGFSYIADVDLSKTKGLDTVKHRGPSYIDSTTFQKSKGQIPKVFLEGCGLRDWEVKSVELYKEGLSDMDIENIVYEVAQLKMGDPIQLHNLFISYSHANGQFVDAIEPYLKNKGIRFWRDIHDGTAGPLDKIVVRAMENRTVLLIFSEDSINSDWVEFEVENARQLEKQYGRNVLCPIALDDSWKDANWSPKLMNQVKKYNILDFSDWKDTNKMQQQFNKLLKGLDIFYKK